MGLFDIFNVSGSGVGLNRAWMDAVSDIASTTASPSAVLPPRRSLCASSDIPDSPCERMIGRRRASNR